MIKLTTMPKKTTSKKKASKKAVKKSVKKVAKKVVRKVPAKKTTLKIKPSKPIGIVTHFYGHIRVAIIKFKQPVKLGAKLRFEGATTKFEDKIISMQYDHKPIKLAPKGKEVGLKVKKQVREGDSVYLAK